MEKSQRLSRPFLIDKRSLWGLFFFAAIAFCFYQAGIGQQDLINPGGFPLLWRFVTASIQPDLSPQLREIALQATLITFAYAVCGTFLSVLIGSIGGIFTSQVWWLSVFPRSNTKPIWLALRLLLAFPRAIHEAIWGLFFVNIWGLDPLTAILAIAIPYGAIVAKVFSEILDDTDRQPLNALINSGVAPLNAFIYTLIPQAFLNLLSYTFYRFECSLRSATVLGIIGAGGLGYQMLLSFQSLRYHQLWTFFYAMVLLNGAVDVGSALLRRRLGCASRLDLNLYRKSKLNKKSRQSDPWLVGTTLGISILIPLCFWYVDPDLSKLSSDRTMQLLADIASKSLPPDLNPQLLAQLLPLSLETVGMSLLAIALAGFGAILLSFPAANNFFLPGGLFNPYQQRFAPLAWLSFVLTRLLLLFCRAIPAPIWALIVLFVLFPGILPGAVALGLHNFGILGRLMAEVNENLEQQPLQALKAQGSPAELVFLYGVLPMTLPRFLAYILYRWEVCTRETVIVGLVGAGGLGRLLTEQLSSFDYRGIVISLGGFIVLTFLVDWISASARRSVR